VMGRTMALATRYEVSAQVASSGVADMLPARCGSETLTTVVSSTSMKVADMTAMATSHGFTLSCVLAGCANASEVRTAMVVRADKSRRFLLDYQLLHSIQKRAAFKPRRTRIQ